MVARFTLKAGAPVGRTSARVEVTVSGVDDLCDEQRFVRSAALVYNGAIRGRQNGNPGSRVEPEACRTIAHRWIWSRTACGIVGWLVTRRVYLSATHVVGLGP